jgi:formylglycine-generating enzyme required for sulfatase activity/serine/threonine protein kinase
MSMQCEKCNHTNNSDAFFCENCGTALDPTTAPAQSDPSDTGNIFFTVGDLISGRYLIVEELSRNALGFIYLVKDTDDNDQQYILKLLHPDLSHDNEAISRFREEVAVCMDPVHEPKIIFDRLQSGQEIHYFLTGPTLEEYQQRRQGNIPPFSLDEILAVMRSLLATLEYAHQFTIHNHISPETIIVMGTFPDVSIRLTGFGVAGPLLASQLTGTEAETRSLVYMAPEQIRNPTASDQRADLFSVGMILYEMLTGEKAVGAFTMPSEYLSDAYKPLDRVLKKVLSPNVDARHSSARELSADITSALAEVTASTKHSSSVPDTKRSEPAAAEPRQEETRFTAEEISGATANDHKEVQDKKTVEPRTKKGHGVPVFFLLTLLAGLVAGGYFLFTGTSLTFDGTTGNDEDLGGMFTSIKPTDARKTVGAVEEINNKKAPQAEQGSLTIVVNPPDARIELSNGSEYRAGMPLPVGKYHVKVSKKGYVTKEKSFSIEQEKKSTISMVLDPEMVRYAHLTILPTPEDATIRILNIKPVYQDNMELRPGRYQIEVSAPGYTTITRWLSLSAGEDQQVEIALREAKKDKIQKEKQFAGLPMTLIQGGCFTMGQSPQEKKQLIEIGGEKKYSKAYQDEIPRHEVCVDSFYLGTFEVTVGQWDSFVRATGYKTDAEKNSGGKNGCYSVKNGRWSYVRGRNWKNTGFPQTENHPVVCVSYNDALAYIRWLNDKHGLGFRLPTEAEWEYAARAGTGTSRFWGEGIDKKACQYANVAPYQRGKKNSFPCDDGYTWTAPVGSFLPNQYGLRDILGNAWEWCSDYYDINYYANSPRTAPKGPSHGRGIKVIRGGSWNGRPAGMRAANRNWATADSRRLTLGFRLAAGLDKGK